MKKQIRLKKYQSGQEVGINPVEITSTKPRWAKYSETYKSNNPFDINKIKQSYSKEANRIGVLGGLHPDELKKEQDLYDWKHNNAVAEGLLKNKIQPKDLSWYEKEMFSKSDYRGYVEDNIFSKRGKEFKGDPVGTTFIEGLEYIGNLGKAMFTPSEDLGLAARGYKTYKNKTQSSDFNNNFTQSVYNNVGETAYNEATNPINWAIGAGMASRTARNIKDVSKFVELDKAVDRGNAWSKNWYESEGFKNRLNSIENIKNEDYYNRMDNRLSENLVEIKDGFVIPKEDAIRKNIPYKEIEIKQAVLEDSPLYVNAKDGKYKSMLEERGGRFQDNIHYNNYLGMSGDFGSGRENLVNATKFNKTPSSLIDAELTAIHEGNHGLTDGDIHVPDIMDNIRNTFDRTLAPELNSKYKKYLLDPGEVYARTMEMRRMLNLSPEQIVTEEMLAPLFNGGVNKENLHGLLSLVSNKKELANLFNKLPAAIPPAIIGGELLNEEMKNKKQKYSFGGDLLKMSLDGLESSTLGMLGMDFYKPKFESDTLGKTNDIFQGVMKGVNKLAPAALNLVPGVGTIASAGLGVVQGIGNQISNTQFKRYGGNMYQSGNEVNTNDMMPYNPNYLDKVSENLIQMDGPSHDRGGIKTPAGEFDKQETVLKKGVVGNPTPFAFSDNLYLSSEVQKQLGLPTRLANKTIADASKIIENKYETNYKDNSLKRSTKDRMKQSLYTKLINANKIEFAKNREMNGINSKEDMSFDELNGGQGQYQSGGRVYKKVILDGQEVNKWIGEDGKLYDSNSDVILPKPQEFSGDMPTEQPQVQQQSPTYKYNNIEYKKVDGQWMWKSNKTGALHPAKNFNDEFIERNNLEPGIEKGFKPRTTSNKKSIQNKTPYDKIENNYDLFYNNKAQDRLKKIRQDFESTWNSKHAGRLFTPSKELDMNRLEEEYMYQMDRSSSFNLTPKEEAELIDFKKRWKERYPTEGFSYPNRKDVSKYRSGMEVDLFPKKKTYENINTTPNWVNSSLDNANGTSGDALRDSRGNYITTDKQLTNRNQKDVERIGYPYMKGMDFSRNSSTNYLTEKDRGEFFNESYNDYVPNAISQKEIQDRAANINVNSLPVNNLYESKDKQSNFFNSMSSLEKIGLGANALSTLGQGLTMMKKDKVPTFYNENSSQVNNIMSDRRIDMQPMINDLNSQYNAATSRDNSRSWNVQRGLNTNMYNQYSKSLGELGMRGQEMNNQYKSQYAETLNNLGQQNVQARTTQEELQTRTNDARTNALRSLMANTGDNLSKFAFTKDFADKTINEGANLLKHISTDFGINAENGQDFVKLITNPKLEFMKIKAEAGGYDGPGALQQAMADIDARNELTEKEKYDFKLELQAMPLKRAATPAKTTTKIETK